MPNVVVANVLHTVEDPARVLREVARVTAPGGRVILTWPLDHLYPDDLSKTERQLGRTRTEAAWANVLRMLIGAPGVLVGARRWAAKDLGRCLEQAAETSSWGPLESRVVLDTVHMSVYTVPARPDPAAA